MGFFGNRIFASFNTLFSRVVNNSNATIVGPTTTLTGEYPQDVSFERLYEYYHGWPQIKRSIDVEHQKFIGAGIKITSNNEEFNDFIKRWWEITNADKKWASFFLSVFITGNGLMERQFAPSPDSNKPLLANIEQVPMQLIERIYRDQFGNDIKLVQVVDGIFKEIDPEFYIRMAINNPDRQAFGKSEFFSVAAPRKVTNSVDPNTQLPNNPGRVMESILDSEAELVDAQTEIKKIVARPKIFGSFPGMPQAQLDKIEKEMADPNNKKYFWAFNKEAKVAEAQVSDQGKFDKYQEDLNNLIALAGGFPEKIITNPGGFSYASSVTPMDVIDEHTANLRNEGGELIRDGLLRPLAQSYGFNDFDEMDVEVSFLPIVRKLKFEEIMQIPDNIVPPLEKREMMKELQVSLNDELYDSEMMKQEMQMQQQQQQEQANIDEDRKSKNPENGTPKILAKPGGGDTPEQSPVNDDRPSPGIGGPEYLMRNPKAFEAYVTQLVSERLGMSNVKMPTSPSNSVNNTTSGRDPNSQQVDETDVDLIGTPPNSTAPPTDLVATAPSQTEPPKVTDPGVMNKLQQEQPKQNDPRIVPPNNEPNPQGNLQAAQQPQAGPGDVGILLPDEDAYGGPKNITDDLAPANPYEIPDEASLTDTPDGDANDQPFISNGQGIGPIQSTMVTEPQGTDQFGTDPAETEEPNNTAWDTVLDNDFPELQPGQYYWTEDDDDKAIMDMPPPFTGGLPPVGVDNEDSGSRGLDLTRPEGTTVKPSNDPDTPNGQDPLKNQKRKSQLVMSSSKEAAPEGDWITVRGAHVLIKPGQSKRDAINDFLTSKDPEHGDKRQQKIQKLIDSMDSGTTKKTSRYGRLKKELTALQKGGQKQADIDDELETQVSRSDKPDRDTLLTDLQDKYEDEFLDGRNKEDFADSNQEDRDMFDEMKPREVYGDQLQEWIEDNHPEEMEKINKQFGMHEDEGPQEKHTFDPDSSRQGSKMEKPKAEPRKDELGEPAEHTATDKEKNDLTSKVLANDDGTMYMKFPKDTTDPMYDIVTQAVQDGLLHEIMNQHGEPTSGITLADPTKWDKEGQPKKSKAEPKVKAEPPKPKEKSDAQQDYETALSDYKDAMDRFDKKMKDYKEEMIKYKEDLKLGKELKKKWTKSDQIYHDAITSGKMHKASTSAIADLMNNKPKSGDTKFGFSSKKVDSSDVSRKRDELVKRGLLYENKNRNDYGMMEYSYHSSHGYQVMKYGRTEPLKPLAPDKPVKRRESISKAKQDQLSRLADRYQKAGGRRGGGAMQDKIESQLASKLDAINSKRDFVKDGHYIIDTSYDREQKRDTGVVSLHRVYRGGLTYPEASRNNGYSSEWVPNDFMVGGKMVKVGDTVSFSDGNADTDVIVSGFDYGGDEWEGPSISGVVVYSSNTSEHPLNQEKHHGNHRVSDVRSIVSSSNTKMRKPSQR